MIKGIGANQVPSLSSNLEFDGCHQASVARTSSGTGSSSRQTVIAQPLNPSRRFRSRFSFLRDIFGFSFNRAAGLGSSESYSLFSTSLVISNPEAGRHVNNSSHGSQNHDGIHLDEDVASSHISPYRDASFGGLRLDHSASVFSVHQQNDEIFSSQDVTGNNIHSGIVPAMNVSSGSNHTEIESFETRCPYRHIRAQEPVEGNAQFSHTLSVGRLRDRILRRTISNEGSFGHLQEDDFVGDISQGHGRRLWGAVAGAASDGNSAILHDSSRYCLSGASSSVNSSREYDLDSPLFGEQSNSYDLLEHRTSFLERRRRSRSQVRALQRFSNRFDNLRGHDRSCILSGQQHTGRCLCQTITPANGMDDDQSNRASISRIVVLAEALFEVLEEIHQQSVILPSRSVSSIGSVPAPKEVVECMPLRIYARSHKHQIEAAAQCYICLMEYEEGDCMRVLPCHHEFHQTCVDKWLKEIHRVCPLCRGDVCRSDLESIEKVE